MLCFNELQESLNRLICGSQMMTVRRSLTEILLHVTDAEIRAVCQEELARYAAAQGTERPRLAGPPINTKRTERTSHSHSVMSQCCSQSRLTDSYFRCCQRSEYSCVVINVGFIYW